MYPYENPALSPEARASDLLGRMSLEEKMGQVNCCFYSHGDLDRTAAHGIGQVSTLEFRGLDSPEEAARVQRDLQEKIMSLSEHHIPAVFHMEGLNGALVQDALSFPEGIGRGASFDPALEREIGQIVARQELALGITQIFAPVLDVGRDPRMGRLSESYGEDPALAAALGSAMTQGIQGTAVDGRRAECAAKHFLAFHNSLGGIHGADCQIGKRQLREVYAKPFQAAVSEGKLRGIMPCYDTLNGKPVSVSKELLTGLLREEMGFDGVAVSDYSAISNVHTTQKLYETLEDAGYAALEAGLDAELPTSAAYNEKLAERFRNGQADMAVLDRAVERILRAKFRMGLFERPFALEGEKLCRAFRREADRNVTLQSARESIILLKNKGNVLPISKTVKKIAVIGPHAVNARFFFGGYTHLSMVEATHAAANSLAGVDAANRGGEYPRVPGTQIQSDETAEFDAILHKLKPDCRNLLEELRQRLPETEIVWAYGYPIAGREDSHYAQALEIAADADVILLTLGGKNGSGSIASMGEGVDGADIYLPACQEGFIRRAAQLGKPLVGLHFDGRPISSDASDQCLDAILECWNPAERGAEAVTDILLGVVSPSGRLPVSVACHAGQLPIFYGHPNGSAWHQGESIGFPTYVDLSHTPRYPFGFGLSYTGFAYRGCCLTKKAVAPDEPLTLRALVRNTGNRPGTEVVQLYFRDLYASMVRPQLELAGFARITLQPGEEKAVTWTMHPSQLAFLDQDMRWRVEKGEVELLLGASSEDIRWRDTFTVTETGFVKCRERAFYCLGQVREKDM